MKIQKTRTRFPLVPAILISVVLAAPAPSPAQSLDGRGILDFDREDGRVQLTIKRSSARGNWNSSSSYSLKEFRLRKEDEGALRRRHGG